MLLCIYVCVLWDFSRYIFSLELRQTDWWIYVPLCASNVPINFCYFAIYVCQKAEMSMLFRLALDLIDGKKVRIHECSKNSNLIQGICVSIVIYVFIAKDCVQIHTGSTSTNDGRTGQSAFSVTYFASNLRWLSE